LRAKNDFASSSLTFSYDIIAYFKRNSFSSGQNLYFEALIFVFLDYQRIVLNKIADFFDVTAEPCHGLKFHYFCASLFGIITFEEALSENENREEGMHACLPRGCVCAEAISNVPTSQIETPSKAR
jgi:hypothetical protein